MKMGMLLGFEDSLGTIVELARAGEAAGMGSIYTVEAGRSAVVAAAAVVDATSTATIGTYIVNAYAREPWLAGLIARDLDELSGGRFVLGVGTGNPHFNEWYMGVDTAKPLAKMRDYLTVTRAVAAGRHGERVRHQGEQHSIRWRASWEPTRSRVPVYLSASGPKMMALAGEVSDGVAVGIMSSPRFMAEIARPTARAAAVEAGRDPDELAFPMGALLSVNEDEELARDAVKASICALFHPVPHPYYDSQLRQLGFTDFANAANELMPQGRTREAMDLVPDEVVDTMTITGTPAQCAVRIAEYEGLADEVVAARVAQRNEPAGLAAYDSLFELVGMVSD